MDLFLFLLKKSLSKRKENRLTPDEFEDFNRVREILSPDQWQRFVDLANEQRKALKAMPKAEREMSIMLEAQMMSRRKSEMDAYYKKSVASVSSPVSSSASSASASAAPFSSSGDVPYDNNSYSAASTPLYSISPTPASSLDMDASASHPHHQHSSSYSNKRPGAFFLSAEDLGGIAVIKYSPEKQAFSVSSPPYPSLHESSLLRSCLTCRFLCFSS